MSIIAALAAIIGWVGLALAATLPVCFIGALTRNARHNRKRDLAEAERAALLDGFVIVPTVKNPYHGGVK